jgi:cytoplasmic iron level regulating protein YaaA (DUF328/UPF0246 family)
MSYLITCSGSKVEPIEINPSTLGNLSHGELNPIRERLIIEYENQNVNLDWNKCLPAWRLYSGNRAKLYRQVNDYNWTNPDTNIKILSALFGWINHTDLIPCYNLKMEDKVNINNFQLYVYEYWRNNINLNNFINPLIDIDLLSNKYRKALNIGGKPVAIIPDVAWNDGYGFHKGIWLNNNLDLI